MGSCCSVSLCCNPLLSVCEYNYIHNLPENLESLEKAIEVLKAKRDDVLRRVDREEFTGRQRRLAQVQVWLTKVLAIDNQVSDLLTTNEVELQRLCLCGFCSTNFKKSYCYGKAVVMLLKKVDNLVSQQHFDVVTEEIHIAVVNELPIPSLIVGQEALLERVWNRLMDDEVGIVGLYGMGGVGKTTLLMQINNKFIEIVSRFDIVIWVVVSKGATIYKIQRDIGTKLGLRGEEWDRKNENQRAVDIINILRRLKILLLLDDLWERVDLSAVGIPYPNRENGCKIAFTTRSIKVCRSMGDDDPMEVCCLGPDEAWDLFLNKVGVNTLRRHEDIPQLARTVTSKCGGLPLALNVIGENLACKTVQEWYRVIDMLTISTIEFSAMENGILPILKYSYDNLEGHVKSCFLYCSLFPKDYPIQKRRLIEYWIAEGLINENEGMEKALNRGYDILDILIRACLLLEDNSIVSMNSMVLEMALWITSDYGKHEDQYIIQGGVGLREVPKLKNWRVVKRMSLIENNIEEIVAGFECPELSTLLLQGNHNLWNISEEFFRDMPKLLVLDLSYNHNLYEIPKEISKLASLRYFDLSFTRIHQLPLDLQELRNLIHLNLEHTSMLKNLNGISNLSRLRIFRLRESKVMLDTKLMKELEMLEHLEFVSINISPSLIGDQQFYDSRVAKCVQEVCIKELPTESVEILVFPTEMSNLHDVYIENCGMLEITIKKTVWNKGLTNLCFSNLSSATIQKCDGLKDLTWLLFAPNLTHLNVGNSKQVESIISQEKAASVLDEEMTSTIVPFQKLKCIHLSGLPMLKSIYWRNLCFSNLSSATIEKCDGLKDLTWLLFAPNLTHLNVGNSKQVESIISQEKAASVLDEEMTSTIVPFQKLKCIQLSGLPMLKSIYWRNLCFSNLSSATIKKCDGLKDLTWLLFAPNLTHLNVGNSKQVESIISQEKAASVLDEEMTSTIVPFQKLKCIRLSSLPMLKSIYWSSLPFPCLEEINIEMCPNLRKLPLDSRSVIKIEEFTIKCKEEWIEKVEWEDEATGLRFLPSVKKDID